MDRWNGKQGTMNAFGMLQQENIKDLLRIRVKSFEIIKRIHKQKEFWKRSLEEISNDCDDIMAA